MRPKQLYFGLIGLGVLMIVGLGLGYYWAVGNLKTETAKLAKLTAADTVAQEHIDQLTDLSKKFKDLQPVLSKLNIALPKQANQGQVILQVEQLARQAGMTLPSASFQALNGLPTATSQTVKAGPVLALPISFQLTGTYEQLQAFLKSVERLGRYSSVSSLAITQNSGGKSLAFSITLNVYLKP